MPDRFTVASEGGMPTASVSTNGCEEAGISSGYVESCCRHNSYTLVDEPGTADLVVFYVCGLK